MLSQVKDFARKTKGKTPTRNGDPNAPAGYSGAPSPRRLCLMHRERGWLWPRGSGPDTSLAETVKGEKPLLTG